MLSFAIYDEDYTTISPDSLTLLSNIHYFIDKICPNDLQL